MKLDDFLKKCFEPLVEMGVVGTVTFQLSLDSRGYVRDGSSNKITFSVEIVPKLKNEV